MPFPGCAVGLGGAEMMHTTRNSSEKTEGKNIPPSLGAWSEIPDSFFLPGQQLPAPK